MESVLPQPMCRPMTRVLLLGLFVASFQILGHSQTVKTSPAAINFGSVAVSGSRTQPEVITNTGRTAVVLPPNPPQKFPSPAPPPPFPVFPRFGSLFPFLSFFPKSIRGLLQIFCCSRLCDRRPRQMAELRFHGSSLPQPPNRPPPPAPPRQAPPPRAQGVCPPPRRPPTRPPTGPPGVFPNPPHRAVHLTRWSMECVRRPRMMGSGHHGQHNLDVVALQGALGQQSAGAEHH